MSSRRSPNNGPLQDPGLPPESGPPIEPGASGSEAGIGASGDDQDDWGDEVPLFELRKAALQKMRDDEDGSLWWGLGTYRSDYGRPAPKVALAEAVCQVAAERRQELISAKEAKEAQKAQKAAKEREGLSPDDVKRRQEASIRSKETYRYHQNAKTLLAELRKLPAETLVKSFLGKVPTGADPDNLWLKAILGCGMAGLAEFPPASLMGELPNTLLWHERLSGSGLARYKVGLSLVLEYSRRTLYRSESPGNPRGVEYDAYGDFADFADAVLASAEKRDLVEARSPSQARLIPEPAPQDIFRKLSELVGGMPDSDRLAAALAFHQDLPEKEIARIMTAKATHIQSVRYRFFDSVNKRLDECLSPYVTLHLSALERYQPLAGLLAKIRDFMLSLRTRR